MPRFSFEAVDRAGSAVRGTLEAPSSSLALEQLLASGQTPLRLQSAERLSLARFMPARLLQRFDYHLFLRELGLLLKAGLPVERALLVLQNLSARRHATRTEQVLYRVRGGEPLSQAVKAEIAEAPAYVSRLIAAGEASGKLADVVVRLATSLARTRALRDKLISSLAYPAVVAMTMTIVLYVVFTSVLPRLTPMFTAAGAALPFSTAALLALGNFVSAYGLPLLLAGVFAAVAFVEALKRPGFRLRVDRRLMQVGLANRYEAARYCRNLQTLLEGGLQLDLALAAAQDGAANSAFRAAAAEIRREVAEGGTVRSAFDHARLLPVIAVEFAAVGEETGRLGAMIGEAADLLDHEVEKSLDRLSALVLPAATIVMGALVALIMAGIVTGILAVNDLVR